MKGVAVVSASKKRNNTKLISLLKDFIIYPSYAGLFGFAAFFTVLVLSKIIGYYIGVTHFFDVQIDDVVLSLVGFVLVFLIRILESIRASFR